MSSDDRNWKSVQLAKIDKICLLVHFAIKVSNLLENMTNTRGRSISTLCLNAHFVAKFLRTKGFTWLMNENICSKQCTFVTAAKNLITEIPLGFMSRKSI